MRLLPFRVTASLGVFVVTAGCSLLFGGAEPVDIKPVHTAAFDPSVLPDEGTYQDAVREIKKRNYANALDFLQVARDRAPGDVRVFNAMGVVYDKLGRFDLSARYYAEAAKLAPDSKIVLSNMAYSAALQKALHIGQQPSFATEEGKKSPASIVREASKDSPAQSAKSPVQASAPIIPQVSDKDDGFAANPEQERPAPAPDNIADLVPPAAKAWGGLSILDASETQTGLQVARVVRQRGWVMPAKVFGSIAPQRFTTVLYASSDIAVAMSLASTLPMASRLQICPDGCRGIIVIVGADARDTSSDELRVADAGAASEGK